MFYSTCGQFVTLDNRGSVPPQVACSLENVLGVNNGLYLVSLRPRGIFFSNFNLSSGGARSVRKCLEYHRKGVKEGRVEKAEGGHFGREGGRRFLGGTKGREDENPT